MSWQRRAACRDFPAERIDAVFYSPAGHYAEAKAVCHGTPCPVREQCAAHAKAARERYGYWGCSPAERGFADNGATTGELKCARCETMFPRTARGDGKPPKYCSDLCATAAEYEASRRRKQARRAAALTGTETA